MNKNTKFSAPNIKDFYGNISNSYNKLYEKEQLNKIKLIKNNIKLDGLILDIGSGTGFSKKYFKNLVQLDPNMDMLKKSSGLRVCAKAEFLPFKDKTFNGIISVTALHHTEINKVIQEIKRVSKDAKLAFSILKRSSKFLKIKNLLQKNFNLKGIVEKKDLILVSRTS
jgi:malonyl-CoA O-methyltransferase